MVRAMDRFEGNVEDLDFPDWLFDDDADEPLAPSEDRRVDNEEDEPFEHA